MNEEFDVTYVLKLKDPAAHIFEVSCTIRNPDPNGQVFSLPAWIPGSYMIREFAKNIIQIHAYAGGSLLSLKKLDKQTWQSESTAEMLTISYEVYAWDLSVRTAHFDMTHAYFNGSSVFVRIHGKDRQSCAVEIEPPTIATLASWRLATTLTPLDADDWEFGRYHAADYEELIDHPVEIGNFQTGSFEAAGVRHDIVITGRCKPDIERICRDLLKVCELHIGMFCEPPPFKRYLFQVMVVGSGYGGLEHRASTSLMCSRADLPLVGEVAVSEAYCGFLGLCSHEYFHAWNVKRIKPAVFLPCQLEQEVHTSLLWWFEGATSYYDDLSLVRAGLIDRKTYLQLISRNISRVLSAKGRLKQTIADSSFDTWTKFYKQDENAPNAIVSYYTKGALLCLCLDLYIRIESEHTRSLDDVVRILWTEYAKKGLGVEEDAMENIVLRATGVDVSEFLKRYLYSTEELPLRETLESFGVTLTLRVADGQADFGGVDKEPAQLPTASLGIRTQSAGEGIRIANVFEGGAAHGCGLAAGDVIVAIDHLKVAQDNFEKLIKTFSPGEKVVIHAFRRDELIVFDCILLAAEEDTCVLAFKESTSHAILASWLDGQEFCDQTK
ncbi:MAG: PDZ domain-containing protein [Gammaproteobacteria bacterium]|nr:PDZ domain-containing protein [Gammaproteobacteria bacterium]